MNQFDNTLVWFRRDLRNFDHAALHHALSRSRQVFCVFIFDKTILEPLLAHGPHDRRVAFIHASLQELDAALRSQGKSTPFSGYELPGRVLATVVGGQVAFEAA